MAIDEALAELGRRDRVVLARLALAAERVVSRDVLIDALWDGLAPPSAAKVLQGTIVRLRRRLGVEAIDTTPLGYRLNLPAAEIDVLQFKALATRSRELTEVGSVDRAAYVAGQALALWPAGVEIEQDGIEVHEQLQLADMRRDVEEEHLFLLLSLRGGGDLVEAASELVDADPHRERRWALLARAQYRVGRQADALRTIQRAGRTLREQVGLEPGRELAELERMMLDQDPALDGDTRGETPQVKESLECPYRGLLSFDVDDRDVFYGRERAVGDALTRLSQTGALVIVGASGSGKSSLMRAGVIAALRAEGRRVEVAQLGGPVPSLARWLDGLPAEAIVAVDQFEELFAAAREDAAAAEFVALHNWVGRGALIITLRSDHLDRLAEQPWLAAMAERSLLLLRQPDTDDLRSAIIGPAAASGLRLEPGLVELVMRDVGGEPGALPLMSHALRATWLGREGRTLTVEAYERAGGLRGAIATTADEVYADLAPAERERMRRLMLRLFDNAVDQRPTRARLPIDAAFNEAGGRELVERLSAARLVVAGQEGVTVAHEALATAWPRLAEWLDDDRGAAKQLRHLAESARAWDEMGRPDAELYRGARLAAAIEQHQLADDEYPQLEAEFLAASTRHDADDRRRVEAELERRRRAQRRLRGLVAAIAAFAIVATVIGVIAVSQSRRASAERRRAEAATTISRREALLASADSLRTSRRDLGVLLAAEADRLQSDVHSRSTLLRAFTDSAGLLGFRWFSGPSAALDVVAVDDGRVALLDNRLGVWLQSTSAAQDAAVRLADQRGAGVGLLATDRDRRLLAAYRDNGDGASTIGIYDIADRRLVREIRAASGRTSLALSAEGEFVALAGGSSTAAEIFNVSDGSLLGSVSTPLVEPRPVPLRSAAVAFDGSGTLFVSTLRGSVDEYHLPDLTTVRHLSPVETSPAPTGGLLVVEEGAALLAFGNQDDPQGSVVARWDLRNGELAWSIAPRSPCGDIAYVADIATVYCSYVWGALEAINATSGTPTGTIAVQLGRGGAIAASPDGRHFVVASTSASVLGVWDTAGGGPITTVDVSSARNDNPVAYSVDGSRLLASVLPGSPGDRPGNPFRTPHLIDLTSAAVSDPLEQIFAAAWLGSSLAFVDAEGFGIRDTPTGRTIPVDSGQFTGQPATATTDPRGDRLLVFFDDNSVRLIDAAGRATDVPLRIPPPEEAAFIGGDRVAVVGSDRTLTVVDITSGTRIAGPLQQYESVALAAGGLLAGDRAGWVHTLDPTNLHELIAPFLVGDGPVYDVHINRDSTLLAARTGTEVRLFDLATGQQLGGSIPVARGDYARGSALRPDGLQLAVTNNAGLALWNLDHQAWLDGACELAGRNLSREEWSTYFGRLDYHATCPQFPTPPN